MYTLQFDGLFRSIPNHSERTQAGFMCYGWVIFHDDVPIARGHGCYARGRDATSNIAEYLALVEGLEALLDLGIRHEPIRVIGDARSIIDQMTGEAVVSADRIKPLHQRATRLSECFSSLEWMWIPRRANQEADQLTRRAMRQVRANEDHYLAAIQEIHPQNKHSQHMRKFLPLLDLRVYQPVGLSH